MQTRPWRYTMRKMLPHGTKLLPLTIQHNFRQRDYRMDWPLIQTLVRCMGTPHHWGIILRMLVHPISREAIRNQSPLRYRQIHPYWPKYRQLRSDPPQPQPALIFYPLEGRTYPRSLFIMAVQTRVKQLVGGVETLPIRCPEHRISGTGNVRTLRQHNLCIPNQSNQFCRRCMVGTYILHHRCTGTSTIDFGPGCILRRRYHATANGNLLSFDGSDQPPSLFTTTRKQVYHPTPTTLCSPLPPPLHKLFMAVHTTTTHRWMHLMGILRVSF